jgi:hypothetical protein
MKLLICYSENRPTPLAGKGKRNKFPKLDAEKNVLSSYWKRYFIQIKVGHFFYFFFLFFYFFLSAEWFPFLSS